MIRAIVGVIVGFVVWTVIWLTGHTMLFASEGELMKGGGKLTAVGPLLGILALASASSLICGVTAGAIARRIKPVIVLGVVLLAVGLAVQIAAWDLMPVWYHLTFLVLLIPVTIAGGKVTARG